MVDEKPFVFFFLNLVNGMEFFSMISKSDMDPSCILLNINPIPVKEIPVKVFPIWKYYFHKNSMDSTFMNL